jgi:very-short-patch-repair endonuclease
MSQFAHSIDGLLDANQGTRKCNIKRFIVKHFTRNVHYVLTTSSLLNIGSGGQNKEDVLLTEETFNLCLASFKLKNRYNPSLQVKTIMSLENQTIGFITACLQNVVDMKRQFKIGSYFVDLCFPKQMMTVECDEFGHSDRNPFEEFKREQFISKAGYKIIRFNPNEPEFDLSVVINNICLEIFK